MARLRPDGAEWFIERHRDDASLVPLRRRLTQLIEEFNDAALVALPTSFPPRADDAALASLRRLDDALARFRSRVLAVARALDIADRAVAHNTGTEAAERTEGHRIVGDTLFPCRGHRLWDRHRSRLWQLPPEYRAAKRLYDAERYRQRRNGAEVSQ